jgi:hypothetical protein
VTVTRYSWIIPRNWSKSKRGRLTTRAPERSAWFRNKQPNPWAYGTTMPTMSAGPSARCGVPAIWRRLATTASWVRATLLGSPLVPLELTSSASDAGATASPATAGIRPDVGSPGRAGPRSPAMSSASGVTPAPAPRSPAPSDSTVGVVAAAAAACVTAARVAGLATTKRAPVRASWLASSLAVSSGLAGVTASPAANAPCSTQGNSAPLAATSIRTSPGWAPRSVRPRASRSAESASWS